MDTIERAKEIARLYAEVEALTEQLEALLGGDTPPPNRNVSKAPKTVAVSGYTLEEHKKRRRGPGKCSQCGQLGHTYRTCPKLRSNTPEDEHGYPEDQYADEIRRMTANGASPKVIADVLELPIQTVQKVINTKTLL